MNINSVKVDDLIYIRSYNLYGNERAKYRKAKVIKVLKSSIRVKLLNEDIIFDFDYNFNFSYWKAIEKFSGKLELEFDVEKTEKRIKEDAIYDELKSFREYASKVLMTKVDEIHLTLKSASKEEISTLLEKINAI